jgi:hypothetical protein
VILHENPGCLHAYRLSRDRHLSLHFTVNDFSYQKKFVRPGKKRVPHHHR